MSHSTSPDTSPLALGFNEIRSSWGWFLFLGIVLFALGTICIVANVTATFLTVITLGWFLVFGGITSLIHAFRTHAWRGFFLYLFSALFRGFTGYLLIRYPASGAVTVTLILASFFIIGGLFRAVASGVLKFPRWGWAVLSGIVSVLFGGILLQQMPLSSLWFIGFAIGVDLMLEGISLIGFATALHRMPEVVPYRRAA